MVPISLLVWITLETAAYLAFSRWLLNASWPLAIAESIAGVLCVRANINALTWLYAKKFASPAPRLGLLRTTRMILGEYLAFLFTFLLVLPFERLWMPPDRLPTGSRPILLVHGYGCSRGVWCLLRRRLEAAGHTVATISLAPPYTSMGKLVPQLKQRIEAICQITGSQQVTLVGHSMGGLISRSYLARYGNAHVDRLITLSTPHAGTELGRVGIGQNAREMTPNSLWLRDIGSEAPQVPTISLRNLYDNYVMPQDNQRLAGASDIELPPIGHIALLYDRQTADLLIQCLSLKG